MANHWFKFYGGEYLSDPKMLALSASERSCWLTLLCFASMTEGDGTIRYLTESQLMVQAGVKFDGPEWDHTKGVLDHLQELGMIQQSNGEITIKNWRKRQEMMLSNAERQARFRAKRDSNAKVTQMSQNSNERIEENRIEENRNTLVERFNLFWAMYPRKEQKKKAQVAWLKIKPDQALHDEIIKGLQKFLVCEQWTKDNGRFIPHPTTWLNGERWRDEVKGGKVVSKKYGEIGTTTLRK